MNLASPAAVRDLLQRHSFLPAHKHGQNFLIDGNTLAKIVAAGELSPGDVVLEIGTGLGVLTRALAQAVGESGWVLTIERDRRLFAVHAQTLPADIFPQVHVVEGDALEVDLDALLAGLGPPQSNVSVVANIPYNITSPLIARLLEECQTRLRSIVLLVQKEVAQRLAARPGTPEYGAFTLFAQYYAVVELIGTVPPTVFYPMPKVMSAIVKLTPRAEPLYAGVDPKLLLRIVHAAFQERRKTVANALSSAATGWNKHEASSVLMEVGIDPMRRGETLSLDEFAALARSAAAVVVR